MIKKNLILQLAEIDAFQFGSFQLKSGMISPIYIDLRRIISFPNLLSALSDEIIKISENLKFQTICGVPYTAIPFACALSLKRKFPMVMKRKEKKDYGTKKEIEGVFSPNQICLVIEDILTTGSSIIDTITALNHEQLIIKDVIVVLDREQGGTEKLENRGIMIHSLFQLSKVMSVLVEEKILDPKMVEKVEKWKQSQTYKLI